MTSVIHIVFQGYTTITLNPTTKDLRTIHLHARQCGMSFVSSHCATIPYS